MTTHSKRWRRTPENIVAKFLSLCKEMYYACAAKEVGISRQTGFNFAVKNGLHTPTVRRKPRPLDGLEAALERIKGGAKLREEAQKLGVCINTLRKRIDAIGYVAGSKGENTAARIARERAERRAEAQEEKENFNAYVPATHRRCHKCKKIRLLDFFHTSTICVHCAK